MILEKLKENKKKFIALLVILTIVFLYSFTSWVPRFSVSSEAIWALNLDNDKELVGAHSNVFIAKIIKKSGQRKSKVDNMLVETGFEVEVLKNIKGNLKGKTKIFQEGGHNKIFFIKPDEGGFIKKGKTYLLFINEDYGILGDRMGHQEVIKNSEKYSKEEILNQKEVKDLIERYEEAYKNEIYMVSDIVDNRLTNSYKKYTKKERQEMVNDYFKKRKEKTKEVYINEYKSNGIEVTDEEIDRLVELDYAGIDMKVFDSKEEGREWDMQREKEKRSRDEKNLKELDKIEKEIELRVKKQNFKETNQTNNNISENKK